MTFDSGADMLSLRYTIVDKEITVGPPAPATSFDMTHTDSVGTSKPLVHTNLDITLTGDRNANRKTLVQVPVVSGYVTSRLQTQSDWPPAISGGTSQTNMLVTRRA